MTFYHIDKVLSRKYGKISLTISNINDFDAVKGDIVENKLPKGADSGTLIYTNTIPKGYKIWHKTLSTNFANAVWSNKWFLKKT